jgi:hypothetical protein
MPLSVDASEEQITGLLFVRIVSLHVLGIIVGGFINRDLRLSLKVIQLGTGTLTF